MSINFNLMKMWKIYLCDILLSTYIIDVKLYLINFKSYNHHDTLMCAKAFLRITLILCSHHHP